MRINIGGGPKFRADGWINLDNVGPAPFKLTPKCVLPAPDGSVDLVYSSHALEHLDDATVARVLQESRRVLEPSGTLLIKIPDFDAILAAYQLGDIDYFRRWPNIRTMTETAHNRGVEITLASLAAQCFCGFWNKAFGDMFAGYDLKRPGAYYGPPVMSESELQAVMALDSPHAIAAALRAHVVVHERDYTFNHQNAWDGAEFVALLADHGFVEIDAVAERIIAKHSDVPTISGNANISAYFTASRR